LALTRFVKGEDPIPSQQEVRRALVDLRVGLICVDDAKALIIHEVETIGYLRAFSGRGMVCLRRPQSIATASSFSASTRLPTYAG
jgi:hypothetical protein